jgi:H+/Na+-translocating ferredoxin:NAD+ oxidoreductase subunit C
MSTPNATAVKHKTWSIPGGIHPPENKHQSLQAPIGTLPLPDILVLPLNQHIGAPAKPVVTLGERVLKGQLIAEPAGFVSAAIHAPTSGSVEAIQDHQVPHPSGMTAACILLKPDGRDQWIEHQGIADYLQAEPRTLLDAVRNAGITGMGGAGFPSSVKLAPRQAIDTLIINGTECEPYITADDILMQERAADLIEGIRILARILGNPDNVLIGIEDNKPLAFEAMEAAADGTGFSVMEFPTKYPSGGEKQLIQILTGKEVPSGKLPADLGIVCHNIGTAEAIYRAVALGEPLIRRITTVTGKACSTNRNYEVLLGTPITHLLSNNGFDQRRCTRLVMGGPMMGFTLPDDSVPVIKTTNCVLACDKSEAPAFAPQQPCIRCGMCAEACPASLLPQQLYWYSQSQETDKLKAYNLFDCIECGACAYVCPSNIPLVQYYRAAKGEIRKQDAEKRKSDHARQRFEFHKARLEKAEAEKIAKREARRLAAEAAQTKAADKNSSGTAPSTADDLIKAAMAKAEARKASPEQQQAKLERGVDAARNRLAFAEDKLATAEGESQSAEQLEKLRVAIEEARRKLTEAEKKLAEFEPATTTPAESISAKLQASPRQQLETKIAGLEERIATTREKLAVETDDKVKTALNAGLEKQQHKLADARQQLAALGDHNDTPVADAPAMDAAAAAIAKAKAKAEAMAALSPEQKLDAAIQSLQDRIDKSRAKLEKARAEGSDHVDALQNGLKKLETKLADARRERAALAPVEDSPTLDAAASAIARAQQKAEALATMSPTQKLEANIESLRARIAKSRTKLEQARAEGADHVDALESGLEKLETKLAAAELEKAEMEAQST